MKSLHYLTVQDMLWINLQVTKKVQRFSAVKLEEATFYQYALGQSTNFVSQAARFLSGFMRMRAFNAGSEATAAVGCLTFLRMNGMKVNLTDDQAPAWLEKIRANQGSPVSLLELIVEPDETHRGEGHPNVRNEIKAVIDAYPKTLQSLSRERPLNAG